MLNNRAAKLLSWLGMGSFEGIKAPHQGTSYLKEMVPALLTDCLPYVYYDEETHIFTNQKSQGFVWETAPMMGCTEEMQTTLSQLTQMILPKGSQLQVLLYADPHLDDFFQRWQQGAQGGEEIYETLRASRVDFFKTQSFQPLRNFRVILSYTEKRARTAYEREQLLVTRQKIEQTFQNAFLSLRNYNAQDLLDFGDVFLHPGEGLTPAPKWNPYQDLSSQFFHNDVRLDITEDKILWPLQGQEGRMFRVKDYPDHWTQFGMGDLIGERFNDCLQIPVPFFIHFGVHILDKETTENKLKRKAVSKDKQARTALVKILPTLRDEAIELNFMKHQLELGERMVKTNMSIGLVGQPAAMEKAESTLMSLYRSLGWTLERQHFTHFQSVLGSLPMMWGEGMWNDLEAHHLVNTRLSTECSNLYPLQGEWYGTSRPGMLLTQRRGQVMTWSPFDNKAGNFNIIVVGRSGVGKSVFMQDLMVSNLSLGGRVFVMDVGRSFEKVCNMLKGQYIEFSSDSDLCLNPFTHIPLDKPEEKEDILAMIKPILSLMAAPKRGTTDKEDALLEQAMRKVLDIRRNETTITDIANFLIQHSDPMAKDLGIQLFPFTKEGSYGKYFEGPSNVHFSKPLVVIEMEELKERKDLQAVIVQMMIIQISNLMFKKERNVIPFQLVLEEAWDLLKAQQDGSNQAGALIEAVARKIRKYEGALVVGTQSMQDFESSVAARAAFENSDWMCLLAQKPESIETLKQQGRWSIDASLEKTLKSLQTVGGKYAEILIKGPQGYAVTRLMLDPFSNLLYSTKADEFKAVQRKMAQGLTIVEAIDTILEEKRLHA